MGLSYGNRFQYSTHKQVEEERAGLNKEGVIFWDKINKWIVRMPQPKARLVGSKPFVSVFQHESEEVANKFYSDLKQQLK